LKFRNLSGLRNLTCSGLCLGRLSCV